MGKPNRKALLVFLPTGPYVLFVEGRFTFLLMAGFYFFFFLFFLFVVLTSDKSIVADLFGFIFLCSGLSCLSFLPKIDSLFILWSGQKLPSRVIKSILCGVSVISFLLFALKHQTYLLENIAFSFLMGAFLSFILLVSFQSLRSLE